MFFLVNIYNIQYKRKSKNFISRQDKDYNNISNIVVCNFSINNNYFAYIYPPTCVSCKFLITSGVCSLIPSLVSIDAR